MVIDHPYRPRPQRLEAALADAERPESVLRAWHHSVVVEDMASGAAPKVSALMGAYNYGRYIVEAIVSAMEQDYDPERLELVVVDDGSTDDTVELVRDCMTQYPGRIKLIQQANSGATAATNRARAEASGDLIALLDADDVWLPGKTRRQVAMMMANPELGLTWTRMQLIDGAGRALYNGYGYRGSLPDNQFARVLWENVAVQSSLIIEADLFDPMPANAPYADWWLALRAAQLKKIDYIPEDLVLYRWHGANITGGAGGTKALREAQKGIAFQRWVLREFALDELSERLTPDDMSFVWSGLENQAEKGLTGLGSKFGVLATVDDYDRQDAATDLLSAQAAFDRWDFQTGCLLLLRARACDPYDMRLKDRFEDAIGDANSASTLHDPLAGHNGFVVLTTAEFLLGDDTRLRDYADHMGTARHAALVIDASTMVPSAAERELAALAARCGLDGEDSPTMIGVVGPLQPIQRRRLDRSANAAYADTSTSCISADATVPTFTPASLHQLRALALKWVPRETATTSSESTSSDPAI